MLLLVLLTIGVTYAVFTYTKLGTTENTVTAGTLKFLYTENTGVGSGIALTDALPVSDSIGKAYSTEGKVFDFSIEATNTGTEVIPYEITLRKKSDSTLPEDAVKVYLTDMTEDTDSELLAPTLYSSLIQTEVEVANEVEKTIYTDNVTGNTDNYTKSFRLRMWVDENVDFSNDLYTGKTFTATVNVYSNVPLVPEEELNYRNNTDINSITADATVFSEVEGQAYDYEVSLAENTTEALLTVEPANSDATVSIEKIDSLAYESSNIKRLSASSNVNLTNGDNYFKVTVTSENKEVTKEYTINVRVAENFKERIMTDNTLIEATPTLTTSSNNTSDVSGLYKSTATNDESPTYYFRGNITNNYVEFAEQVWRIMRINEDGTIRLIMQNPINNNASYAFNSVTDNKDSMYYTNSNVKQEIETWYTTNISSNESYSKKVATNNYFCEQAKVSHNTYYITNSGADMALYSEYVPDFKCQKDANGYGLINTNVGLITYDEVVYAGGYVDTENIVYYLYNHTDSWTMSTSGFSGANTGAWRFGYNGAPTNNNVVNTYMLRPVLNLNTSTTITGTGTSTDPYKVF